MDIILASQSPRRRELLSQMGLKGFKVTSPEVDEEIDGNLPPARIVEELSLRKASAVAEHADEDDLIIAADTIVVLDGAVLGKPADEREALEMLTALQGRRHTVCTGVTVRQGQRLLTRAQSTDVYFRPATERELRAYIAGGEPMDKAGAYGVQGQGALLVERIDGDFFNVMGLPVVLLEEMLREFGVVLLG